MSETTTENTSATEDAGQTSADTSTQETSATETSTAEGESGLGDAGKKALDAMKAERNEARKQLRETAERLAALEAKAEGREAEHQKALDAQRVKDEALSAANQRILKAEIRAAAAGKMNDPTDALAYIDLSSFEVDDDGAVDAEAIASAVADLITKKPYLAAQGSRFQGGADGGARNESAEVAQLTHADMARMSPEQIDEAMNKGQFDRLLGRT